MSMQIKARDLIAAGWHEGRRLGAALRRARQLEAEGIPRESLLIRLAEEFPKQLVVALPRTEPAPLAEAIAAETAEETDNVKQVRERMTELLHMPVINRGVIMPDACPVGGSPATIPVGGAIAVENAIIPGAHSADICCSMFATFFPANHPTTEIMDHLQKVTHFGRGGRPRGNHFAYVGRVDFSEAQKTALLAAGYEDLARWIERREGKFNVLVTHHGSRGLGADVYKRGVKAAVKWCRENAKDIPKAAAWLPADSPEGRSYWDALQYVGRWTKQNHALIHEALLRRLGQRALVQIGNEHNFVWKRGDVFLHGKGATPAWRDDQGRPLLGLIPLNMAREILLVLGRDNDDYLSFCPHGAGRNRSRTATLKDFRNDDGELDPARVKASLDETTVGLDIRWFSGAPDLSESPIGYKDATKVKAQIDQFGLADVVGEITPRGCIMAGEAPEMPWQTARRLKKAAHKAERREGAAEAAAE